jgi:hypothetical protein
MRAGGRDGGQRGVELVLAVVAAIDGVGAILGTIELRGVDDLVTQRERLRHLACERTVMFGIAAGCRR